MRIPMQFIGKKAQKGIRASQLRKRTVTAFATLALVVGGILASMPAGATPTVNITSDRMLMQSVSEPVILACGGVCPGICPCPSTSMVGNMINL